MLHPRPTTRRLLALGALAALGLACATPGASGRRFDYFGEATGGGDHDPWYPKVEEWQGRARAEGTRLPGSSRSPEAARNSAQLLEKLGAFRDVERRRLARDIHDLGLALARRFYRFDPGENPMYDHWPTVGELLANNGDDCDGLDLIAYQLLREFGFPPDQVYRAVVRRDRDGANHMVTLWFEQRDDPWVLDATGAVAVEFHRLSELPGWTPTKVFNERTQFNVVEHDAGRPLAAGR
jgi:hypothetical protein